jgi:nucleoside-diphosphate-sugar epimerase
VERLLGSVARLRGATTWAPQVDLREGLRRTIGWFSDAANRAGYKWDRYNV